MLLFTLSGDNSTLYTLNNRALIILLNSLVISLKPGNWEHLGTFGNIKRTKREISGKRQGNIRRDKKFHEGRIVSG